MADNPLKRLRAEIERAAPSEKVTKSNRTLYLNKTQFDAFREYCEAKGAKPSEIVDRLIAMYMNEVNEA